MILDIGILLIYSIGLYVIFLLLKKVRSFQNLISKELKDVQNRILHLYTLTDIISENNSIFIKLLYNHIRNCEPDKIPKSKKEIYLILKEIITEQFKQGRNILHEKSFQEKDPLNRKKLDSELEELDNILTLLNTIDKDTSEEYSENIFKNVLMSVLKMSGYNPNDDENRWPE